MGMLAKLQDHCEPLACIPKPSHGPEVEAVPGAWGQDHLGVGGLVGDDGDGGHVGAGRSACGGVDEVVALLAVGVAASAHVRVHLLPTGRSPLRDPVSDYGVGSYRSWYRTTVVGLAILGALEARSRRLAAPPLLAPPVSPPPASHG